MQTESSHKARTVVVSGVPHVLPVDRMIDKLTIHFQRSRRSNGGDVEEVTYPTNLEGVAFVTFDRAEDAARVVQKEHQIMSDSEFLEDYRLTAFPFTTDVFFYITNATLDLSVFGSDQAELLQSLRSAHKSIYFRPLLQQSKVSIEGPFTAVQALREDIISRSSGHKSAASAQTAAVTRWQTTVNPPAVPHCEPVSPRSYGASETNLEPVSSLGLSTPLQTTGEATEVQSLFSNAKTPKYPSRQNLSSESWTSGSFGSTNSNTEETLESGSFQMARPSCVITPDDRGSSPSTTENRAERTKADRGAEVNAGISVVLSGLDLLSAEQISTEQPGVSDTSQHQNTPDGISPAENHFKSQPIRKKHRIESDDSSTLSLDTDMDDTDQLSTDSPGELEVDSIWVDSSIYRYIVKFENTLFQQYLTGPDVVMECSEENELTQIKLIGKPRAKTSSEVQLAMELLKTSMEFWQSFLRVHFIALDTDEWSEKDRLVQICDDVSSVYANVLYVVEDSCIKVIGPSVYSHQFCQSVRHRISDLKTHPVTVSSV